MNKNSMTEREAAEYICMSRSFLAQDRMNGPREARTKGPAYIKVGRAIRYLKSDLDLWLEQHRIAPAA